VDAESRRKALTDLPDAIRLGAPLEREEISMALKLVEDFDSDTAAKAWDVALNLLEKGRLDKEQLAYLACRAYEHKDVQRRNDVLTAIEKKTPPEGLGHQKGDEAILQFRRMLYATDLLLDRPQFRRGDGRPSIAPAPKKITNG